VAGVKPSIKEIEMRKITITITAYEDLFEGEMAEDTIKEILAGNLTIDDFKNMESDGIYLNITAIDE
jgi:hypothetical protein